MIDLVYWSFVLALTPIVLGLAWKLIVGIEHAVAHGFARALEHAEPWELVRAEAWDPPSSTFAMPANRPRHGAGHS